MVMFSVVSNCLFTSPWGFLIHENKKHVDLPRTLTSTFGPKKPQSVQTCSLGDPPDSSTLDLFKLFHLGAPSSASQICSKLFPFCPFIYLQAGGWPSIEKRPSCYS